MSLNNHPDRDCLRISRILVATDFSDQAGGALQWAQSFAGAFGAKLVLLHVIDIFSIAEAGCVMAGSDPLPLLREQAQKSMGDLMLLVPNAETVIREASPRPAIVDGALDLDCQLIVMGTHGRSGLALAHLLLGSTAEYVVRNSKVPVLTVRAL
jgi:nucleotide-binding universal stress UspA family protein